jgi:predicted DNA-binding transcriptional regulator YafY
MDAVLGPGYGIFSGKEIEWATLKFAPHRARWVANEVWHPKQKARFEVDGSFVLELPYADDRELLMDILKFGADVKVLGPQSLIERVAQEIQQMKQAYQ